jgi:integrase
MGVKLREKKLSNGQVSLYLDIYHNKRRSYEFLEIYVNKSRPTPDDKEKRRMAGEIRVKRENELIAQKNTLIDWNKQKADFVGWYVKFIGEKNENAVFTGVLKHLRKFAKDRPVPFSSITPEWCMDFLKYLLTQVQHNTARQYFLNVFTGLEEAEIKGIIQKNPMRLIPKKDRIKKLDTKRTAYTIEQLQLLVETPCKIKEQYKQAYLFSCFTGLRWSDVNPLRWDEIITKEIEGKQQHFIYFEQEKTEGVSYFPLSEQAVQILEVRKQDMKQLGYNSPYVFPQVKETNEKTNRVYCRVWTALKKWAEAAGLDKSCMKFHTGRHTFATNVLELGGEDGDLWTVSKLLGHKNIQSTMIYAQVRDKKKVSAVQSLPVLNMGAMSMKVA